MVKRTFLKYFLLLKMKRIGGNTQKERNKSRKEFEDCGDLEIVI